MATKTAGTLLTTTLTAIQYSPDPGVMANADVATIALGIMRDAGQAQPAGATGGFAPATSDGGGNAPGGAFAIFSGAFTRQGLLWLPNRTTNGPMNIQPGDWVAIDGFGNAFPIPQRAMPKTLVLSITLTNGSNVATCATDIRAAGWQVGTHVTSAHTPAGTVIGSIAPSGKSFTLVAFATGAVANATGSQAENMTAGTFTHS